MDEEEKMGVDVVITLHRYELWQRPDLRGIYNFSQAAASSS